MTDNSIDRVVGSAHRSDDRTISRLERFQRWLGFPWAGAVLRSAAFRKPTTFLAKMRNAHCEAGYLYRSRTLTKQAVNAIDFRKIASDYPPLASSARIAGVLFIGPKRAPRRSAANHYRRGVLATANPPRGGRQRTSIGRRIPGSESKLCPRMGLTHIIGTLAKPERLPHSHRKYTRGPTG